MRVPRHPRTLGTRRSIILSLTTVAFTVAVLAVVTGSGASGTADRLNSARRESLPSGAKTTNQAFGGVAAVGALFTEAAGKLKEHFCTASVIDSPGGDIAVSAAHCLSGIALPVAFAPGYNNGSTPYGVWQVTKVYTPSAWQSSQDPDDDVAFLRLAPASDGVPVQDVTGAEQLGTGWPSHTYVQVIGYPDGSDQPVWCANWTDGFSPTQLQFACGGYTVGTSGGPFLAGASGPSGQGTVIGVIGGYQQGGDTADVSYSVIFGPTVASLYRTAVAGG